MNIYHLLDLIIASQENSTSVMDVLWHHRHHATHLAVDCLTTSSMPLQTYVKSPVASLCFVCSSLRYLESVMISVLMDSLPTAPPSLDILLLVFVLTKDKVDFEEICSAFCDCERRQCEGIWSFVRQKARNDIRCGVVE